MCSNKKLTIAVDFDGTIVEHKYPEIGKAIPNAIEVLKELEADGHKIILWTCRDGELLKEAMEYCKNKGLNFFSINESYPEEEYNHYISRKICADIYIDDRNFGGLPDWKYIRKILLG